MEPLNFMGTELWRVRTEFRHNLYESLTNKNFLFFVLWPDNLSSSNSDGGILGTELKWIVGPL